MFSLRLSEIRIHDWTDLEDEFRQFTQAFELYLSLPVDVPKDKAVGVANKVARWVSREESSLWLKDTPVF